MKSPYTGVGRLLGALRYSWQGMCATYQHEAAFRQEVWGLFILVLLAVWLSESIGQFVLLVGSWLLVMVVELLNSAIESVVDRTGDEYHLLSGRAKDQGSAAVLFSLVIALLVWISVIWENLG